MVKSKLVKELSKLDNDNCKMVTSKIRKPRKNTEALQMRKLQVKLHSSSTIRNLENLPSATPFSKKLMITSTPFNAETNKPNGKRLPSRFPLSPIFSNASETKQQVVNAELCPKFKQSDLEVAKENSPKCQVRVSKYIHDKVDPAIRTGFRKKSFGVRKITQALENAAPIIVDKQNKESRTSRLHEPRRCSAIETISSDSDSSNSTQRHAVNHNNQSFRSCIFSDSSCSPDKITDHRRATTDKISPSSGVQSSLVKRLQSDWSSSSFGEKTDLQNSSKRTKSNKSADLHNTTQQVRQNKCSKLRVCLRNNILDTKTPSTDVSHTRGKCNTLVNQLKSDWASTTLQETPDMRTTKDNHPQIKQVGKRRLTTLIEMSVEERTIPSQTLTATPRISHGTKKKNNIEDEYSSSAEFQSDDETNNHSRSKRAPTWRELLNKTNEFSVVKEKRSPEVRLKRLRTLSPKNDGKTSLSPGNKENKSQEKQTHDKSDGDDKVVGIENGENSRNRKKQRVDPVIETLKHVPLQETKARGRSSKRLSSKNDKQNSLSPEKQERKLQPKVKHDRSDDKDVPDDKEAKRTKSPIRNKKLPVAEVSSDTPLQENHARRSKMIKNARRNSSSPETQEKKPQQKVKHDRSNDILPNNKKTKGNIQTRKKNQTVAEVSSDVPLRENLAKRSKMPSSRSVAVPVLSLDLEEQKPQRKDKQDTGLIECSSKDKLSSHNEETQKKHTKEDSDVGKTLKDTPSIEAEKQMQNSAENIDESEANVQQTI